MERENGCCYVSENSSWFLHSFPFLWYFPSIKKKEKKKGQNTLSKIQLLPDPHSSSGFTVLLKSMSKYFWKVWAFSFAWCVVLCLLIQLCPTLCGPMDCSLPGSSIHGDSPGKNTRVDCHDLLQGIFPTQGLNPGLPHCRQILYHLNNQWNPSPVQWHINRTSTFGEDKEENLQNTLAALVELDSLGIFLFLSIEDMVLWLDWGLELPYNPTTPFLGIYQERTIIHKDTWTPVFIAALFTIPGHGRNLNVHRGGNG